MRPRGYSVFWTLLLIALINEYSFLFYSIFFQIVIRVAATVSCYREETCSRLHYRHRVRGSLLPGAHCLRYCLRAVRQSQPRQRQLHRPQPARLTKTPTRGHQCKIQFNQEQGSEERWYGLGWKLIIVLFLIGVLNSNDLEKCILHFNLIMCFLAHSRVPNVPSSPPSWPSAALCGRANGKQPYGCGKMTRVYDHVFKTVHMTRYKFAYFTLLLLT